MSENSERTQIIEKILRPQRLSGAAFEAAARAVDTLPTAALVAAEARLQPRDPQGGYQPI